jgi:hypothetical protein
MSTKPNENAQRWTAVSHRLEMKLKMIADFEAGKWTFSVRHEHKTPLTTYKSLADKQKYKDVKLEVPGTNNPLKPYLPAILTICIYGSCMVLTVNSNYFLKQYWSL